MRPRIALAVTKAHVEVLERGQGESAKEGVQPGSNHLDLDAAQLGVGDRPRGKSAQDGALVFVCGEARDDEGAEMITASEKLNQERAAKQGKVHVQLDEIVPGEVDPIEGLQVIVEALERGGEKAFGRSREVDGGGVAVGGDAETLDGEISVGFRDEEGGQGRAMPPKIGTLADEGAEPDYNRGKQCRVRSKHVDVVEDSNGQRDALGSRKPRLASAAIHLTGGFLKMDGKRGPEAGGGHCHGMPMTAHPGEHHGCLDVPWGDVGCFGQAVVKDLAQDLWRDPTRGRNKRLMSKQ